MGTKDLLGAIKKKGFKFNIFKVKTQPEPFKIEHKMREEFKRHRVVHVLQEVSDLLRKLGDPKSLGLCNTTVGDINNLRKKVDGLIVEILSFKS